MFITPGGAISWQSKLVGNASLSSCESRNLALAMAMQEAGFLRQLQLRMQGKVGVPTSVRVYLDSQPALDLVNNPVYYARSKRSTTFSETVSTTKRK